MAALSRPSPRASVLLVGALAVGAFILVGLATRQGAGASHDSTVYVAGAEAIADGDGYRGWDDRQVTTSPPGFSSTLAIGDKLGVSPRTGARWLNALAAAGLVVLTFVLARRHVRRPEVALVAAAAVAVAPQTVDVFSYVWTEPLFCVMAVGLILLLERLYERRAQGVGLLVGAGALGGLLFAYRFVGTALVAASVLVLALAARADGVVAVIRRLAAFGAAAAVLPAAVVIRSASVGASLLGDRTEPLTTVGELAEDTLTVGSTWVLPDAFPRALRLLALLAVIVMVVAGLVLRRRSSADSGGAEDPALFEGRSGERLVAGDASAEPQLSTGSGGAEDLAVVEGRSEERLLPEGGSAEPSLVPLGAVTVAYLALLFEVAATSELDPISLRLLAPAFVPGVVLAAVAADHLVPLVRPRLLRLAATGLVGAWLLGCLVFSFNHARLWGREGRAMQDESWTSSELLEVVRDADLEGRIFANVPEAVFYRAGIRPVSQTPSVGSQDDLLQLAEVIQEQGETYLVWFDDRPTDGEVVPPEELDGPGRRVTEVERVADGTLYRIG